MGESGKEVPCKTKAQLKGFIELYEEKFFFINYDCSSTLMIPVKSSNISHIGIPILSTDLIVLFNNGGLYLYFNASYKLICNFLNADSVGKYLNKEIKNKYKFINLLPE